MSSNTSLKAVEEVNQSKRHPRGRIVAVFIYTIPIALAVLGIFSFDLKPRPTIIAVSHFHEFNPTSHPSGCPLSRNQQYGGMLRFDVLNFADDSYNIKELHVSKIDKNKVVDVTSSGGIRPTQEELNKQLHNKEGVSVDETEYYFAPPAGITLKGQNAFHLDFFLTESQCRQANCFDKYSDTISSLNLESSTQNNDRVNYIGLNLTDLLKQRYLVDRWGRVILGWASGILIAVLLTVLWLKTGIYRYTY